MNISVGISNFIFRLSPGENILNNYLSSHFFAFFQLEYEPHEVLVFIYLFTTELPAFRKESGTVDIERVMDFLVNFFFFYTGDFWHNKV